MKTAKLIRSVSVLFVLFSSLSVAAPQIGSSRQGRHYLVSSDMLAGWSTGVYYSDARRDVELRGWQRRMKTTSTGAFVGYDVLRWITVFGLVGSGDTDFTGTPKSTSNTEYGLSAQINLMDHEIMDPGLIENRLQINLQAAYMKYKADEFGRSVKWDDLSAGLILSVINDSNALKIFWVESIALYAGPIYSRLDSDSRLSEKSNTGYAAGIEVGFSEKVSLTFGVEDIDQQSSKGSLTIRF